MKAVVCKIVAFIVVSTAITSCMSQRPTLRLTPVPTLVRIEPGAVSMANDLSARLDSIVKVAMSEGAAPGVALAVGRYSRLVHLKSYGHIDNTPDSPPVTDSTMFDMASLTKVVATTTALMILEDEGRLNLDSTVRFYIPELNDSSKAKITVRQILTHNAGFEAFAPLWREHKGRADYLSQINLRPLVYNPGDTTIYSDWDFILAGFLVERISGMTLDQFTATRVWQPLGMHDTGFNPLGAVPPDSTCTAVLPSDQPLANHPVLNRIAVTELDTAYRHMKIHGIVHDENACALGGVSGHAGLFSSVRDAAVFSQMMLNGGQYNGVRLIKPTTVARWTSVQSGHSSRAIGWDTPSENSSSGRFFSQRSFGHTGFTGTSIWIDPERGVFVVLLTNRVNPTRANLRHDALRRDIANAVQASILDAPLIQWREK
ncbi:MAG TPA: serine hydrolase [Gemmatimonadaceae bacterium]|nr:serine hydrolase [Gemmatimonadaceae bacterium]